MKKKLLALFCIVCQYVISTGTISNTSTYQPQSVTAKLLVIVSSDKPTVKRRIKEMELISISDCDKTLRN